jgi:hypothetical protein
MEFGVLAGGVAERLGGPVHEVQDARLECLGRDRRQRDRRLALVVQAHAGAERDRVHQEVQLVEQQVREVPGLRVSTMPSSEMNRPAVIFLMLVLQGGGRVASGDHSSLSDGLGSARGARSPQAGWRAMLDSSRQVRIRLTYHGEAMPSRATC